MGSFTTRRAHHTLIVLLAIAPMLFAYQSAASGASNTRQMIGLPGSSDDTYQVFIPAMYTHMSPPIWTQVSFDDYTVTDFLLDPEMPNHAYATVYLLGLFRTEDGGNSWVQASALPWRLNDIEMHPITHTDMYAAAWGEAGVYRSSDRGMSWDPVPGWAYLYPGILAVATHPISPSVMFAGSGNWEPLGGEIYKTTDTGETWYAVSPQFTNAMSFALEPLSPTIGYAGTRLRGVYKTTDGGDTWLAANEGLPTHANNVSLVIHPQRPEEIYAATEAGLYVSHDGAASWHALWTGVTARSVLVDSGDPERVYLGTSNGIFVSHDGGAIWYSLQPCGRDISTNRLAIDSRAPSVLWAATSDGLWRCDNS